MRKPEITHKIMSSIHSKNTKPELLLRRALWHKGMRYRVAVNTLPGKPDIVFTKAKIVVFCDGGFWHGHNWAIRGMASLEEELAGYSSYWKEKIKKNINHDIEVTNELTNMGWMVIRLWESEIKKDLDICVDRIVECYSSAVEE